MKLLNNFFSAKKDNFLFFVMIVFLFLASSAINLSSSAMAITGSKSPVQQLSSSTVYSSKSFPPLPVLEASTSYPVLSAQGVYAVDIDSGITLYEKNADAPLLPASTTKIVTALVVLDNYKLDQVLVVPKGVNVDGQKMGLYVGETMKVEDLLYGLLVYSANDAAETFAIDFPGGYDAFIDAMNAKARELSMTNSHFDNPVGLDSDSQRSTVKDLFRASEVAMRDSEFAKIVGTKETVAHDTTGKVSYDLKNVNQLLGVVPGVVGIKTGWTESARENLVTYIVRNNHRVIIAILGSTDRFGETKELIDWIFSNYNWTEVKI